MSGSNLDNLKEKEKGKKVKMYYRGKILLKADKLGHYFCELDEKLKETNKIFFTDKRSFAFGYLYEVELWDDGKLKIGKCLDEGLKDADLLKDWEVEHLSWISRYEEAKSNKMFVRESKKGFENITLGELRERCLANSRFRMAVLHWVMGGRL